MRTTDKYIAIMFLVSGSFSATHLVQSLCMALASCSGLTWRLRTFTGYYTTLERGFDVVD